MWMGSWVSRGKHRSESKGKVRWWWFWCVAKLILVQMQSVLCITVKHLVLGEMKTYGSSSTEIAQIESSTVRCCLSMESMDVSSWNLPQAVCCSSFRFVEIQGEHCPVCWVLTVSSAERWSWTLWSAPLRIELSEIVHIKYFYKNTPKCAGGKTKVCLGYAYLTVSERCCWNAWCWWENMHKHSNETLESGRNQCSLVEHNSSQCSFIFIRT